MLKQFVEALYILLINTLVAMGLAILLIVCLPILGVASLIQKTRLV